MPFIHESNLIEQVFLQYQSEVSAIIAIDEVGRGCVAGPVLTCASLWIKSEQAHHQSWLPQIKDSKKLTSQKRLACFKAVLSDFHYTLDSLPFKNSTFIPNLSSHHKENLLVKPKFVFKYKPMTLKKEGQRSFQCIGFCLGEGHLDEVERFNIWNATQIAASRALLGLEEFYLKKLNTPMARLLILMDGNKPIMVPAHFLNVIQATAVNADDLFPSVGLSSILAKVYRDLYMESQESLYPQFGFAQHKGYATSLHLKKIKEHGVCPLHRLSFLKNYVSSSV